MQAQYGDLYTESNVAMSGIHTHSGPGGYLQYILYIITSLGFVRESFDVLVGGILEARLFKDPANSLTSTAGTWETCVANTGLTLYLAVLHAEHQAGA